jgi:hypothetical protein
MMQSILLYTLFSCKVKCLTSYAQFTSNDDLAIELDEGHLTSPLLCPGRRFGQPDLPSGSASMTSVVSVPAYLSPGVPIVQPPHLEGDETYGTEILPGPPPLVSVQQSAPKRDPKKPSAVVSYLPASDPGSTYSSAGSLGAMEDGPMRKRARVDDKGYVFIIFASASFLLTVIPRFFVYRTLDLPLHICCYPMNTPISHRLSSSATSRAQRASARHLNGSGPNSDVLASNEIATTSSSQLLMDSDTSPLPPDIERLSISRSSSAMNMPEDGSAGADGAKTLTRKEKGKGTERDGAINRVKEEPQTVSLATVEPVSTLVSFNFYFHANAHSITS